MEGETTKTPEFSLKGNAHTKTQKEYQKENALAIDYSITRARELG